MATLFEKLSSELSFIRSNDLQCNWNATLSYCQTTMISLGADYHPTDEDFFLYDTLFKIFQRGNRPLTSYFCEKFIVNQYGRLFSLSEKPREGGSIRYTFNPEFVTAYQNFTDIIDPWQGSIDQVEFDPQHPENECKFFAHLVDRFGNKIAHCIETQVGIDKILSPQPAAAFLGQRVDFLLQFPNGKRLVLEPGDHDDPRQVALDIRRDRAFESLGISTIRLRNNQINDPAIYDQIEHRLGQCDSIKYLEVKQQSRSKAELAANYLFLLPSLITRVERLLLHFWFRQGFARKSEIRIGIIERDLECAEISLVSFQDHLLRLCRLYGIDCPWPKIQLFVRRNPAYRFGNIKQQDLSAQECQSFEGLSLDLILDVSIKCNSLTKSELTGASHAGAVRQTFVHNQPVRFGYLSRVRPIKISADTDELLNTFVQDFFRKYELRPGQSPILHNILSQKPTIGLLPTSAGKSLCYQLSSLLTPGTTIVVDPIVALMNDQVQGLADLYGVDHVFAWHAASNIQDQDVASLLSGNIMVFLSPERLQRPGFRQAMRALNAADIYINYAVIDEAHCVSMWGHDFRPSYLMLERNFREYCTFQGRPPVLVALTGTASQLVLIDLKRELNIQDLQAIIRPKTFDRPELYFSLVRCPGNGKEQTLGQVMAAISRRLNVQQLETEAHGIIFAYLPGELWNLFGQRIANAADYVRTVLNDGDQGELRYGVYTGSPPPPSGLNSREWDRYKERTLKAFKRGDIRMLFGNTAVGVGIDNERLNYIINYRMPQSIEAYYQQCGRAGRSGQRSECYLIFSDDSPQLTQRWLNREYEIMPGRWDDLGTVTYFHQNNFPGKMVDCDGACSVFQNLFGQSDAQGMVPVRENGNETTERYLSYWIILGVVTDYEVTGIGQNTVYHIRRHHVIDQYLEDGNESVLKSHMVDSLHRHLSRYRPALRAEIEAGVDSRQEDRLSKKFIGYLVNFVYSQIEYQRRESVRTMVSFCNQTDTSPEKLRQIIRGYFDSSEKFSETLLKMADGDPNFDIVAQMLDQIEGFDDVEHLFWETRRLLDERFRSDWAASNLFAVIYRERGIASDYFYRLFDEIMNALTDVHSLNDQTTFRFLAKFLSYLSKLDTVFGEPVSGSLQADCAVRVYKKYGLACTQIVELMDIPEDICEFINLQIVNCQLKEIINGRHSRIIG